MENERESISKRTEQIFQTEFYSTALHTFVKQEIQRVQEENRDECPAQSQNFHTENKRGIRFEVFEILFYVFLLKGHFAKGFSSTMLLLKNYTKNVKFELNSFCKVLREYS